MTGRGFWRDPRRLLAALLLAVLALVLTSRHAHGAGTAGPPARDGGGLYGPSSLAALWRQAGGSAATSANAACHAMQESSGDPSATSPNPDGGVNIGLWQLDTRGQGAGYTVTQLRDPLTNARVAVRATRDGANWSSWATPGC